MAMITYCLSANLNFESFVVVSTSASTLSDLYFFLVNLLKRSHNNLHGHFALFEALTIFIHFGKPKVNLNQLTVNEF
jgi:hypothetical protein